MKRLVVKIGGHALDTPELLAACADSIARLVEQDVRIAVVHGGGAQLTKTLRAFGKQSEFVSGFRVTDAETRDVALMVLAGAVNKALVAALTKRGVLAVGLLDRPAHAHGLRRGCRTRRGDNRAGERQSNCFDHVNPPECQRAPSQRGGAHIIGQVGSMSAGLIGSLRFPIPEASSVHYARRGDPNWTIMRTTGRDPFQEETVMLRVARHGVMLSIMAASFAATAAGQTHWVTSWAASVQGPYPVGNPSAQPNLSLVFPSAETGARDQSFRLIVKPEFWGAKARMRFSNALGTQPVTFDGAFVGMQWSGSAVTPGTNRAITFGGKRSVTVAPGESVWSDAVALPFVNKGSELRGRKLAVSFHVAGASGPMTWHAKALQSSYVTLPG